jgi:glycosyltransferase involved in cell wall biosynthesis
LLVWAKERVKKLPGATRLAHELRPRLVRLVGERLASLVINSPDNVEYRSVTRTGAEQRGMVSVIVPSFNTETCLDLCLDSVATQGCSHFECIVVDDGSTDGSLGVAKRWVDRDRRFRLVAHKAHGGLSAARNTGLLNAVGEYVTFLNSDDFMSQGALSGRMRVAPLVRRSILIAAGGFDESSAQARAFDVLFLPHKDYHVWTASSIITELEAAGLSCACVDLTYAYGDEGAKASLGRHGVDSITINEYLMIATPPKAIVCFNDWETRVVRPIIEQCNDEGIPTIGMVEGVQDFDDADTGGNRRPYRTVRHVFLAGRYDRKFFRGTEQHLYEIGVPRIEELLREPIRKPGSPIVVVNLNFTYGVLTDQARDWLDSVVGACAMAGLPYVVSQHPADETDLDGWETSELDMYELIRRGSVFVSRFSSGMLESLALGKPVVYHNPHGERVDKFQDAMGVYRITESVAELTKELVRLAKWNGAVRDDAREFLDRHCNIAGGTSSAAAAAARICEIVGR